MIKQSQRSKIHILLCAMLVILIICVSLFSVPSIKAEGEFIDHAIYSSAFCNMMVGKKLIGTIRLTIYLHFKADGNFLIYAQAQIAPRIDDKSNRYRFNSLQLNIEYAEQNDTMNIYDIKTNNVNPIITTSYGTTSTTSNEGVKFEFNSSTNISAEAGSMSIDRIDHEPLPGVGQINKEFRIAANSQETSKVYNPAIAIFGRNRTPNKMSAFIIEIKNLDVLGIALAPNFEASLSKWFRICGMGDATSAVSSDFQVDGNGGADRFELISFASQSYRQGVPVNN